MCVCTAPSNGKQNKVEHLNSMQRSAHSISNSNSFAFMGIGRSNRQTHTHTHLWKRVFGEEIVCEIWRALCSQSTRRRFQWMKLHSNGIIFKKQCPFPSLSHRSIANTPFKNATVHAIQCSRISHSFGKIIIWFVFAKKMHVRACFRLLFTIVTDYTVSFATLALSCCYCRCRRRRRHCNHHCAQLCFLFQFEQPYHVQRFFEFCKHFRAISCTPS